MGILGKSSFSWIWIFVAFVTFPFPGSYAQRLQVGMPFLEERIRLSQLEGNWDASVSLFIRPLDLGNYAKNTEQILGTDSIFSLKENQKVISKQKKFEINSLPLMSISGFSVGNPYPNTSILLINNGFQNYFTGGLFVKAGILSVQIQPEYIIAQNQEYDPGRAKSWNIEYIERFGQKSYSKFLPGQSSVRLNFGAFSAGVSTENIWWGPGQFNALLFSNNAFGFPHFTLNTRRPAKTLFGNIETQLIVGKLEGADVNNTSIENIIDEPRYFNGISFSIQPRGLPNLFLGFSRVFQQYESFQGDSFTDYFPIFDPFQKKDKFVNGNDSGIFDQEGRDQQITSEGRYLIPKAKMEFYFEYGRRDHAFDWREAMLNPEHARAYLLGFTKISKLNGVQSLLFRGEILQQQESINILVRYPGTGGSLNWSGHGVVRHGFTNYGQMMGAGIGPGSNSQTLEISWLKPTQKIGFLFERVNRYQDFYTANFNDPSPANRWVDFSSSFLGDFKMKNLILTSRLNFIKTYNRDWLPVSGSGVDFSIGRSDFSFQGQIGVLFFLPGTSKNHLKTD